MRDIPWKLENPHKITETDLTALEERFGFRNAGGYAAILFTAQRRHTSARSENRSGTMQTD